MLFVNIGLLFGLALISIPILIHLFHRRAIKKVDWGAMQFLIDSLRRRRRRILIEEILLLACRCLLLGLLALAMARPFITAGSGVPWLVVLPLLLLAVVAVGTAVAAWQYRAWRRWLLIGAGGLLLAAAGAVGLERALDLRRFGRGGDRDVAIVVDASSSMSLPVDGQKNFERAVAEAEQIVKNASRRAAFSVILGGPVPAAHTPAPVADRRTVVATLEDLKPTGGAFNPPDALALAAVTLAQGYNTAKQIVVITDGQAVGWETDRPARWQLLADMFKSLPTPPQVVLRRLKLPTVTRNVAVTDLTFSREVVGVDREVGLSVRIDNTGTEAVTPTEVKLECDGATLTDNTAGQIEPGESATVKFNHRFKKSGSQVVQVTAVVDDDMPEDNHLVRVLDVVDRLPVLIVDGNPGLRFLERAGAFASMALAPGKPDAAHPPAAAEPAPFEKYVVEPDTIDVTDARALDNLSRYCAVILADVPRLPAEARVQLEDYVAAGGGLLIAPGERAAPDFYNPWTLAGGQLFCPARLAGRVVTNALENPVTPALNTFRHRALRVVADTAQSDLGGATLSAYWRLSEPAADAAVHVGGRLSNGDPFLLERRYGKGTVLMLCCSLDTQSGNLATRQAFVPFLHEMVYYLALANSLDLNLAPGEGLTLRIPMQGLTSLRGNQTGLSGVYYAAQDFRKVVLTRIDPQLNFNWGAGAPGPGVPADGFAVRWSGSLVPRFTEPYTINAFADDWINVWIDGKPIITRGGNATVNLVAGHHHDLWVEYGEGTGDARLGVLWSSQHQPQELIPESQLSLLRGEGVDAQEEDEVVGPDGVKRVALVHNGAEGLSVRVKGDVVPGLYKLTTKGECGALLTGLRAADGTVPFTVGRDAHESRLTPLIPDDLALMRKYVDVIEAASVEQVRQALLGKAFGEELWKQLAMMAFLLLVAEIALTRWIAGQRRTGEKQDVEFEERTGPSSSFRRQLASVLNWGKKAAAPPPEAAQTEAR